MNIDQQLARDEGRVLKPYQDTRGLWTIGVGHLLGATVPAQFLQGITDAQCDALFSADLMHVRQLLDTYVPWWHELDGIDGPRSNVLVNMGFNLGVPGLAGFHHFLYFMHQGKWADAAADLAATLVFKQLPERYGRLKTQIETGIWQ